MSDTPPEPGWLIDAAKVIGGGVIVQFFNYLTTRQKVSAEAQKAADEGTAALETIVSDRIKSLLEHYEDRVKDLMAEVHSLRMEVTELRKALDKRPSMFGT